MTTTYSSTNFSMGRELPGRQTIRQSIRMSGGARRFLKKYGVALCGILLLFVWTSVACAITAHNTRFEIEERLATQYEARLATELQAYRDQQAAQNLLTGNASLEARMSEEADALARLLYGYRNNSKRDRVTLVWCVLARVDNSNYPGSVEGVVDQAQQWMFYESNNPIREEDRELALEQLRIWHEGRYPSGLTSDFVFAEWSQTTIRLFDNFENWNAREYWRAAE